MTRPVKMWSRQRALQRAVWRFSNEQSDVTSQRLNPNEKTPENCSSLSTILALPSSVPICSKLPSPHPILPHCLVFGRIKTAVLRWFVINLESSTEANSVKNRFALKSNHHLKALDKLCKVTPGDSARSPLQEHSRCYKLPFAKCVNQSVWKERKAWKACLEGHGKIHGKIHGKSAWMFDLSAEVPRVAERKLTL